MSTRDSFRGVELLDFMWHDERTTCASNNISDSAGVDTAGPPPLLLLPILDYDMHGPPELNTTHMRYLRNITRPPTWEIAVKVHVQCDTLL